MKESLYSEKAWKSPCIRKKPTLICCTQFKFLNTTRWRSLLTDNCLQFKQWKIISVYLKSQTKRNKTTTSFFFCLFWKRLVWVPSVAAESHGTNCTKSRELQLSLLSVLKTFTRYKCALLSIEEVSCSLLLAAGFWVQARVQVRSRKSRLPQSTLRQRFTFPSSPLTVSWNEHGTIFTALVSEEHNTFLPNY